MRHLTLIAALSATTALPLAGQQRMVRDPATGVEFPAAAVVDMTDTLYLMGTGVRTRTILKVKVYAFGLYVQRDGARQHLARFANIPHYELEENEDFFAALLRLNFPMGLRLVMTRDVGADQMASAFEDALRPRVEAAASNGMPGGVQGLETFSGYFDAGEMTEGSELLFTCTPDGTLRTHVKGNARPDLTSRALCWALFDVYLGEDPISRDGKKGVVLGFPNLLLQRD